MSRHLVITSALLICLLAGATAAEAAAPQVRIRGNQIVDGAGLPMRLIGTTAGVGAAHACVEPTYGEAPRRSSLNVFSTPADDRQLALMRSWHMNTVRITLNQGCWMGLVPVAHEDQRIVVLQGEAGRIAAARKRLAYRALIVDLVRRAHRMGFVTIVDLHYNAPGDTIAYAQWPLPDRDHSHDFWRSVARTFRDDRSMVFEVFNEPYDERVTWRCLRDGCRLPNASTETESPPPDCPVSRCPTKSGPAGTYRAAGMQELVTTIRAAGARQPLLVPGLGYAGDLSRWLEFRPRDPLRQLGATFHMYGDHRYDPGCADEACWDRDVARVAAAFPVVTTEFGQTDCRHDVMDRYQRWADARGVSYLAWGWYVADAPPCGNTPTEPDVTPAMLLDYDGTPSPEGAGFKAHLAGLHAAGRLP